MHMLETRSLARSSTDRTTAIQNAAKDPASTRGVTANWVQSVNDWYPGSSTVPDIDDGEEAGSADVILRAKGISVARPPQLFLPSN